MKSEWVALLLVLALCAGARPATIYVDDNAPGDPVPYNPGVVAPKYSDPQEDGSAQHPFDDIQKAINAAQDGDTIIVAPGQYLGRDPWDNYNELKFHGKNVRLVSSAPTDFDVANETILCGVIIFDGTEDPNCLLHGFKIQNYNYGGILGNKTHARISHCIISGNGPCGATVVKDVYGRISNCLIVDNTTFHDCGILPVVAGCRELINCTIANNASNVQITDYGLPGAGYITMRNCILYSNQGTLAYHTEASNLAHGPWTNQIEYCMIEYTFGMVPSQSSSYDPFLQHTDPCFVRPGHWERVRNPWAGSPTTMMDVLIEGDYHLRSQGWQWSPQLIHGSHWYYDTWTSPAIDAGDPMDSLGEEPERVPEDPQGQWGFNHGIDLGAYGGTTQASLGPTGDSPAPGAGTVDLHDYWPLLGRSSHHWTIHNPLGSPRMYVVSDPDGYLNWVPPGYQVWVLEQANSGSPNTVPKVYCLYLNQTFYLIVEQAMLDLLPAAPKWFQAKYPQYFVVGATIQAPYDPFSQLPVQYRSVLVARGTLVQVLAGTSITPAQLLPGEWPDVIALKEKKQSGAIGDPIAIFARGFGPLLLAGQPVEGAEVSGKTFGPVETLTPPAARPATRG